MSNALVIAESPLKRQQPNLQLVASQRQPFFLFLVLSCLLTGSGYLAAGEGTFGSFIFVVAKLVSNLQTQTCRQHHNTHHRLRELTKYTTKV